MLRYVALGDSYTIGTSVEEADRWPNRLAERLRATRTPLDLVANLGVNGYTSQDVIDAELPQIDPLRPGFVSLLVGVNDVVQGVPRGRYRENAATLLDRLLARLPPDRIVTIATPDYTVTPQGAAFGEPRRQRARIEEHNRTLRELSARRGITYVDTFPISLEAATNPALVASDGLHPSGAQYAMWVDAIAPVVARLLATEPGARPDQPSFRSS